MQWSLYILALLISGFISVTLAVFGFRRYNEPVMAAFGYLMSTIAIWAFGSAGESLFTTLGVKLFWSIVIYAGNQPSPILFLIFILLLTRSGTWFPERYFPILFIIPAISILIAGTNGIHHMLWTSASIIQTPFAGSTLYVEHGPWFPIEVMYIYLVLGVALICIIRSIMKSPDVFNRQMTIILVAALIPIIGNIVYTQYGEVLKGIDLTPLLFAVTGLLCWYAISRHRLFDIFPALYEQIFTSMHEGVIILDHRDRIISINPSAETYTTLTGTVIGEKAESVLSFWPELDRLLSDSDHTIEVNSSDNRWLLVRGYRIPSGYADGDGRLIIIQDITTGKRLRKDLEKSTEDIRRANVKINLMNGIVNHDIANELTIILSALDMITPPDDPLERELFHQSGESTRNIINLVRFAREYQEIGIRAPEWIDIYPVIEEEMTLFPQKIRFINDISPGTAIHADPLIRIVIRNLLDNAIRHGGSITMVRFYCEETADTWRLICEDDGTGVPEKDKEKIFVRGYGSNTGMGLYLIREILSISDMIITENGKEGEGARFVIDIPRDSVRIIVLK